ncbi:unnamed protein product, partial [Amoebophrya sp. A120]
KNGSTSSSTRILADLEEDECCRSEAAAPEGGDTASEAAAKGVSGSGKKTCSSCRVLGTTPGNTNKGLQVEKEDHPPPKSLSAAKNVSSLRDDHVDAAGRTRSSCSSKAAINFYQDVTSGRPEPPVARSPKGIS